MNTAIIMLGSNTDSDSNMVLAVSKLVTCFEIISKSIQVITEPCGIQFSCHFHNVAIKLKTTENQEDTISVFKRIETQMGRKWDSKLTGIIPIDIDMIFWNNILVHEDYNRYEYVKNCINEIY